MENTSLAVIENDSTDKFTQDYYPEVAQLSKNHRAILIALTTNMCSEVRQTETEIAESLGLCRSTLYEARKNPLFGDVLARITTDIIKGLTDKVVVNLLNLAGSNVKANEILLRIAEVYKPTSRIMSQNVNINARTAYADSDEMVTAFLSELKAMGYTAEKITALYNAL